MRLRVSKWSISWVKKRWRSNKMTNAVILAVFIFCLILFFWGVHRAVKTQKKIYLLAFIPFMLLIAGMFFL